MSPDLKKLFVYATAQIQSLFKDSYYDPIYGVAMCSPLVPVLDNPFMAQEWIYDAVALVFYCRCVDDMWMICG